MLTIDQIQARCTATTDQLDAVCREHEMEVHGEGDHCLDARASVAAFVFVALGLTQTDFRHAIAFGLACAVFEQQRDQQRQKNKNKRRNED